MAGDTTPGAQDAQALWDEVTKEREAGVAAAPVVAEEAKPEDTSAETPEANAEAPEKTQEATEKQPEQSDPFAGLSPAVQERLKRLDSIEGQLAVLPQLTQALKTAEGRVAAMQREMDAARTAAKAAPQQAPTQAQISAAQASTDKWNALKRDFPDWADATEELITARLAGVPKNDGVTSQQVEQVVRDSVSAAQAATSRLIEEAKLEGKHPEWRVLINTPQFQEWYGKQPPDVRSLGASEAGRDAIKLLDTYHEAVAMPADKVAEERKAKLAAAASTRPSATPASTAKTVDQMTQKELWDYEAKQGRKRNAGLTY